MLITNRLRILIILLLSQLAFAGFAASAMAQAKEPFTLIDFQAGPASIKPTRFYILRVDDERKDKTSLGKLAIMSNSITKLASVLPLQIKGGGVAVTTFIANSLPANKALKPLVIKLQMLDVDEKLITGGRAEGRIKIAMQFGLYRNYEFIKLDDYSASSTYQRSVGAAQLIEPFLNQVINNGLKYIETWINSQANKNILLANSVTIIFTDHKDKAEGDTIYYDINRPLKWTDFQGKPHSSKNAAEIFASLGYDEDVKLSNGLINVKLDIKVYVPKSACWVRSGGLDNNSLMHEQRHFDIVKLVSERFKRRILNEKLSTDNYDGPINMAYLDALREIYQLQTQYDSETSHGVDANQQQQWNLRLEKELQKSGVKKFTAQAADFN